MLIAAGVTGAIVRSIQLFVILRLAGVSWRECIAPYRDFLLLSLPGLALIISALPFDNNWGTTVGAACYFGIAI